MYEQDMVCTILDSTLKMTRERRQFTRMAFKAKVIIYLDDEVIEGELVNISLSGAFVVPQKPIAAGTVVELAILDRTTPQNLSNITAKVVRTMDDGIGLHFE